MQEPGIVIVGLGPAGANLLTREAWDWFNSLSEVYLRTAFHPCVGGLPTGLEVHSFDDVYEQEDNLAAVLAEISQRVLQLGRRPGGVTYGVPGSPWVAEETTVQILAAAKEEGLPVRVIDGMSFVEPVCAALGIDPSAKLFFVDALHLADRYVPSFPPSYAALISQITAGMPLSEVKLTSDE